MAAKKEVFEAKGEPVCAALMAGHHPPSGNIHRAQAPKSRVHPRALCSYPLIALSARYEHFSFLFIGLENASLLMESRISRKPPVGV